MHDIAIEIEKYRIVAEKSAVEREVSDKALNGGKKWQGKYPMICMMHTLVDHNEIKREYLTHQDLLSGQIGIENCNTAATMAQNVWQLIPDKWNDVSLNPSINAMDYYSDFFASGVIVVDILCGFATATAEKGEVRWGEMVLALNRIIKNWKRSVQGDSGFQDNSDDDDAYYGALADCTQKALENYANFIKDF